VQRRILPVFASFPGSKWNAATTVVSLAWKKRDKQNNGNPTTAREERESGEKGNAERGTVEVESTPAGRSGLGRSPGNLQAHPRG